MDGTFASCPPSYIRSNEFEQFRHTAFTADHFVEDISFDRMEVEFLEDDGKKRKSDDPRNDFSL